MVYNSSEVVKIIFDTGRPKRTNFNFHPLHFPPSLIMSRSSRKNIFKKKYPEHRKALAAENNVSFSSSALVPVPGTVSGLANLHRIEGESTFAFIRRFGISEGRGYGDIHDAFTISPQPGQYSPTACEQIKTPYRER